MIGDAEDAVGVAVGLGRVETLLQEGDHLQGPLVVQLEGGSFQRGPKSIRNGCQCKKLECSS